MGVTIRQEQGNVYEMRITGLLRKSELDTVQAAASKMLSTDPAMRVKLLMVVENFKGWERGADWGDLTFYAEHGDKITKIAIVGDPKLETEFKMFTGAGFRAAPVKFYPSSQLAQARAWLAEQNSRLQT